MAVDLELLAAELTAAGLECLIENSSLYADTPKAEDRAERRWVITSFGHIHFGEKRWGQWADSGLIAKYDWQYLDIIRRYVSPGQRVVHSDFGCTLWTAKEGTDGNGND